ncbi:MAG: hypothetical protein ACQERC_10795 [Bacteroidota bacterium]
MKTGLFTLSFLVLILFSCKKEQPTMHGDTKDPCDCASEVSADFVIEEYTGPISDLWIQTDTTLHDKYVRFRALEDDAEYTWYIGADVETIQTPSKFFSDQWTGSDIPITLVVKKDPNKTCFPDDDGYDSITKTFHVSQYPVFHGYDDDIEYGTIEGIYRVYSKELDDSIDITVDAEQFNDSRSINIFNVDGGGAICEKVAWRRINHDAYRQLSFGPGTVTAGLCEGLSGLIRNPLNGFAELKFKTYFLEGTSTYNEKTYHYYGRKLN